MPDDEGLGGIEESKAQPPNEEDGRNFMTRLYEDENFVMEKTALEE